ncbi:MAG: hypothetical protein HY690_15405 [Chloroflexi bacterium]|nr:hypothetical protein [Chloroflexota bacterium]
MSTPGSNVTRAIFGALNIGIGQWDYLIRERIRWEDFIVLLEHLLLVYPNVPIILILDNYNCWGQVELGDRIDPVRQTVYGPGGT